MITPVDADGISPLADGSTVLSYLPPTTAGSIQHLTSQGSASELYRMMRIRPDWAVWGVFARESHADAPTPLRGHLVGIAAILTMRPLGVGARTGDSLTVIFDQQYQGRGIGRRVLSAVTRAALGDQLTLDVVQASIHPDNEAALRLYRGAGFVDVGTSNGRDELWQLTPMLGQSAITLAERRAAELGGQPPDVLAGLATVQDILDYDG